MAQAGGNFASDSMLEDNADTMNANISVHPRFARPAVVDEQQLLGRLPRPLLQLAWSRLPGLQTALYIVQR